MRWARASRSLAGLGAILAIILTGCAGNPDNRVEITVATFGEFGYDSLFAEYEKAHPDIHLVGRVADFDSHHKGLITALAAGRGAADVARSRSSTCRSFASPRTSSWTSPSSGRANYGRAGRAWKWKQGVADNGEFVLGLGTDMGSLAMCYRRDLFERAGLPTGRDAVASLWPTWEATRRWRTASPSRVPEVKFTDSAGTIYTAILNQAEQNYFAKSDDSFVADTNPNVRRAFTAGGRDRCEEADRQRSPPSRNHGMWRSTRAASRRSPAPRGCSPRSNRRAARATAANGT